MLSQEKIERAKSRLMLEHPYFGTIASALKLESSDRVETFQSDGNRVKFNDAYLDSARIDEVEFALANGAMHSVLKHEKREGQRSTPLWQLATDLTVNAMLVKNGLTLPQRANYQKRFEGMYAEEIYAILYSEFAGDEWSDDLESSGQSSEEEIENERTSEPNGRDGEEPGKSRIHQERSVSSGDAPEESAQAEESREDGFEKGDGNEQIDREEEERIREEFLEHIFGKMSRQGTLPKDLKLLVPRYFSHQIDWRERLYRYIASYAKSSYTFIPPNMKYLYRGIYLPSLGSDLLRIVIAIDTSGSVDERLLGIFLGEVESIVQQYPNFEIDMITADAKIQSHHIFLPGERLEYEIQGRGGTDFRPVFDYIESFIENPTLLIYFTDGIGTFPDQEPMYDTFWIMPEVREVPFGDILQIDQ